MTQVRFRLLSLKLAIPAMALLALLGGCGSSQRGKPETEKVTPVAMKGQSPFFEGKLDATITVSRGLVRGGFGGKGRRGDTTPDVYDIFSTELNDETRHDQMQTLEKMSALQVRGSPMPPVVINLILANHSGQPIEVEILEVNSELGNFAVKPAKISISADTSAQPDPLNSQLGVMSDDIPFKITLRSNGVTQSLVVPVRNLFVPPPKK